MATNQHSLESLWDLLFSKTVLSNLCLSILLLTSLFFYIQINTLNVPSASHSLNSKQMTSPY